MLLAVFTLVSSAATHAQQWALAATRRFPGIRLKQVEESFTGLSTQDALAAYAYSYLAVRHILNRYGELALQRLLRAYATSAKAEDAFVNALSVELPTFEDDLRFEHGIS